MSLEGFKTTQPRLWLTGQAGAPHPGPATGLQIPLPGGRDPQHHCRDCRVPSPTRPPVSKPRPHGLLPSPSPFQPHGQSPSRHDPQAGAHPFYSPLPSAPIYLRPGVLRPARIFCTRKGRPRRQLRAVDTLRIWPPCPGRGCGEEREHQTRKLCPWPRPGPPPLGPPLSTHPFHDPAVHLHRLPCHGERPGARPTATQPPPERGE